MTWQVQQLSECPQHLEAVGNWIFDQWWSRRHDSAEVVLAWLRTHMQKDKVPYTVVALVGGIPVGSCSVIQNDCVHRPIFTMGRCSVCETGDAPPWHRFGHAPGGGSHRQKG